LRVHVHLFKDRCTLLVDTSGESLHKRGWRCSQGTAPLAETLAAGLVLLSGWDRRSPLMDPFCGSGTLLIEAALIADDAAPGLFREEFGFMRMPDFDASAWKRLVEAARERIRPQTKLQLTGCDQSKDIVEGAKANLRAAGLEGRANLQADDARAVEIKAGWNGMIMTNPPYGERVGDERSLYALYELVGKRWRQEAAGYSIALFSGNGKLDSKLGVKFHKRVALKNGALDCELLLGKL
jgi:putative N6-adenine-specific DNA methylase